MFVYLSANLIIFFLNPLSVSESSESEVQPFLKYDQNGNLERERERARERALFTWGEKYINPHVNDLECPLTFANRRPFSMEKVCAQRSNFLEI